MNEKTLKVSELEVGKIYDMVDNPHPNYLLYFVDEEGLLRTYDTVVKCNGTSSISYNNSLKTEFYEV